VLTKQQQTFGFDRGLNQFMEKPKTIRTPYGDITLLPITPEDLEKMKQSLLSDPELDLELEKEYCQDE
jgi:hypothetical protein